MRITGVVVVALASAALVPGVAEAAPPWSTPAVVPGAAYYDAPVVFTPAGHGAIVGHGDTGSVDDTLITAVGPDGALGRSQRIDVSYARVATFGTDGIAVAGARRATTGAEARRAPIELATGTPTGGVGAPRALPGTAGQQLFALAGHASGTVALVTATAAGHRERIVWIRRGGKLRRALTIRVGERAGGAAAAVGSKGDVLVAWEDNRQIFSRHIGPTGRAGTARRLGAGVESAIQARYDESGRQEVAWESQRAGLGDALAPATISYTSAQRGHGFTAAQVVGRSALTGTGRYLAAPGVRLVGSGTDSSVLAFTVYDGANFRVQEANAAAGKVQTPLTVSPAGEDCVLGDLAYARAGGTLVLWRSGTRGSDPSGPQQVFASTRPAGQFAFGAPEAISDPVSATSPPAVTIPSSPFGAVDPKTGAALATFGTAAMATASVVVSARTPLR